MIDKQKHFINILLFISLVLFLSGWLFLPPKIVYVPVTKTVTIIKEVKVPAVVVHQHDNKIIIQPTIKTCQKYLLHEDNEMDKGEKLAHECYR
jgi:hypothetical protein